MKVYGPSKVYSPESRRLKSIKHITRTHFSGQTAIREHAKKTKSKKKLSQEQEHEKYVCSFIPASHKQSEIINQRVSIDEKDRRKVFKMLIRPLTDSAEVYTWLSRWKIVFGGEQ